jgi:hypothetical protein
MSIFFISAAISRWMKSSYVCWSGVCRLGCCGVCVFVGVTSALFAGGEKRPGTGDFRGSSGAGCGKNGAAFFSGDGGKGILAAVLTESTGLPRVCNGAKRLVGDGGGLRTVSSFSSP